MGKSKVKRGHFWERNIKMPLPQSVEELEILTEWYFGKPLHFRFLRVGYYKVEESYNSYHGPGFAFDFSCTKGYDHSRDFWNQVCGPLSCGGIAVRSYGQFNCRSYRGKKRIEKFWVNSGKGSSSIRPQFARLAARLREQKEQRNIPDKGCAE